MNKVVNLQEIFVFYNDNYMRWRLKCEIYVIGIIEKTSRLKLSKEIMMCEMLYIW